MTRTYQVLTTPAFEREFKKLVRKNPGIRKYLELTLEILETDPQNVTRSHDIKQLKDVKPGDGQFRIRKGEWRLRYDVSGHDVVLHSFRHRREAYK
jgi:mRNA-degrading endonuclease RelE of RelBE toxin-antitoxin system